MHRHPQHPPPAVIPRHAHTLRHKGCHHSQLSISHLHSPMPHQHVRTPAYQSPHYTSSPHNRSDPSPSRHLHVLINPKLTPNTHLHPHPSPFFGSASHRPPGHLSINSGQTVPRRGLAAGLGVSLCYRGREAACLGWADGRYGKGKRRDGVI